MSNISIIQSSNSALCNALTRMKIDFTQDASSISQSRYILVADGPGYDNFKIRISDHELPPSYAEGGRCLLVGPWNNGYDWQEAIIIISKWTGVLLDAHTRAVVTRYKNKKEKEKELKSYYEKLYAARITRYPTMEEIDAYLLQCECALTRKIIVWKKTLLQQKKEQGKKTSKFMQSFKKRMKKIIEGDFDPVTYIKRVKETTGINILEA